jgi:hypothetical protein
MLNTDQQGKPTPIRVVLVDDHGIFRAGLEMLFEKQPDLELVGQAEDGESALPMIRQPQENCGSRPIRSSRSGP